MQQTNFSSRRVLGLVGLLAILIPRSAPARDIHLNQAASSQGLAFARYIASIQEPNVFQSGRVAVKIDAALPGFYRVASLLALRDLGESERSEYQVLQVEGDGIVAQEVIAPYFLVEEGLGDLTSSSLAISPANYKFHYKGEIGTGGALAYVYDITPKKKRDGLIQGQLWIDSNGAAVLVAGHFVKMPFPFTGKIQMVRNMELVGGSFLRTTHVTFDVPRAGRGELMITELRLPEAGEAKESAFAPLSQD